MSSQESINTLSSIHNERSRLGLEVLKARIEFAKYGFYGTLAGSICGVLALLVLALIDGLWKLRLGQAIYIVLIVSYMLGAIAFGCLSLWSLPRIRGRVPGADFDIDGG